MIKTVTIQIGNSDDKLKQSEWADYVIKIDLLVDLFAYKIHFHGGPSPFEMWQNAAWVVEFFEKDLPSIKERLSGIGKQFNQDSIAWTEGITEFI